MTAKRVGLLFRLLLFVLVVIAIGIVVASAVTGPNETGSASPFRPAPDTLGRDRSG
jgi:hypothetical protein